MPSTSALRLQIEHALQRRFPAALSPVQRTIRETAATGIPAVDELLQGGLPVGAISEITGPVSSGRTSLALAFLAARTQEERVCAWVDAHDAFDSESAAANGMALRQLLWVRCRRGQTTAERLPKPAPAARRTGTRPDFLHLDQALRATDLLLQAGGFAAVVLDLGSTPAEQCARIPLATWFRFRQAADRTRCSLLVLGQEPMAQSSATVVLACARQASPPAAETVFAGCCYEVRTGRATPHTSTPFLATQRKPPASTWSANAAWQRETSA
jgi:hypothetical protein